MPRTRNPLPPEEDPERNIGTHARAGRPDLDPERNNKTQARARKPRSRESEPELEDETEAQGEDAPVEAASSYDTGANYQAIEGEDDPSMPQDIAALSLDGEGLDALDPEVALKTSTGSKKRKRHSEEEPASGDEDDDANATHAGPPIKLEVVSGPDAGKKKKFKGVRMVVGRTAGVDFLLSDQSVSRRHIELVHSDAGTLLRDLGSGNGTKLNKEKITQDTMLKHGDEIQIGRTKLRFIDEVAAFKQAREEAEKKEAEEKDAEAKASGGEDEAGAAEDADGDGDEAGEADGADAGPKKERSKSRTNPVKTGRHAPRPGLVERWKAINPKVRIGVVAATMAVLVLLGVGIASRPPPPPSVDPRAEAAALKMQEARNALKDGRFDDAVKAVEEAEHLSPGIDRTKLGAQAREGLSVANKLEEVKRYVGEKRFEDARKLLETTPVGNVKNEEEREKIEAQIESAQLGYKREKVLEFLAAGELDAAKRTAAELPADQQGDIPQQIAEFEKTFETSKAQEAKEARQAANAAVAFKQQQREEQVGVAFAIVERKFAGGDWERATSECSRVLDSYSGDKEIVSRAKSLAAQIPNFGRNYDEGMKKYKQGQLAAAAKPLRQAFQAYRSMGLVQNRYGEELRDALLKAAITAGKEALIREDLENAMANFREARRIEPSDPDARKGFEAVADKAEDLYQSGYMVKDRDPREALKKFKTVIAITESGTPVHEKAKNQVAAMAP
jgi:pSer/pThr/pTyr-binding forkhead associated (FHA) protein